MKTRNIYYTVLCIYLAIQLVGCSDDFLNRPPQTTITEASFWKTTKDLETYINQFYAVFPGFYGYDAGPIEWDKNSDNLIPASYNTRLAGFSTTPTTGRSLFYGNIRSVNYFLEKGNAMQVSENQMTEKLALLGEGYFFRAWYYFDLLSNYGGVPWINKVLTTESSELYNPRDPRNVIADNILADLDKAIEYLYPVSSAVRFRINKEIALAFKARVALFEGTWEKYHTGTVFGAPGGNSQKYLQAAAQAARDLIDAKYGTTYAIFSTGKPHEDYFNLFNQTDLSGNSEVIFWKKYDVAMGTGHNSQRYIGFIANQNGVSKSLVDSYLCTNGRPISDSDGLYQGDNLPYDVFENRDPRLSQLIFVKGDPITIQNGDTITKFSVGPVHMASERYCPTGYQMKKGSTAENTNNAQTVDFSSTTAAIQFRYAETLLIYAEAKAELNELTQNDIDISVNKIRDRVNMPHLLMAQIAPDPNWDFSDISPVLNEIRRERRIELACDGIRFNDLRRWRAHHLITGQKPLGIKFNPADYPTLVVGQNVYLSSDGYVEPYATVLPNGWLFKPERDYLSPLTLEDLTVCPDWEQNPGWDKP